MFGSGVIFHAFFPSLHRVYLKMALFAGFSRVVLRLCAVERQVAVGCTNRLASTSHEHSHAADEPLSDMKNPYQKEKDSCILCKLGVRPTYKNVKLLSQFISPYTGLIYPRNITRLCYHQQEHVVREIERARRAGLMARQIKEPEYFKDPALFDPSRPIRPHRF